MAKAKSKRVGHFPQGPAVWNYLHGMSQTPEHAVWRRMLGRCYRKTCDRYAYYGGRGIKVCQWWRDAFLNFYGDMGVRPSKGYSIDRIDTNGHYSCGHCDECKANGWTANCRWATQHEQTRNYSRNRLVTFRGETLTIKDWADKLAIPYGALSQRLLKLHWSAEDALTVPVILGRNHHSATPSLPPAFADMRKR